MSIWGRARAKADELIGRAEEVYGESHGDAAAKAAGEARRLEGEAEEEAELGGTTDRRPPPDDGGVPARH
ncbi:hypothetical protein [Geodermatophilus sabuli]|uniref:CsbD family protein n=1 Tax=Geodermatophilus sabuli TaxID=1564158 RepID=A0A285EJF5_9ACTN|nr:hypothetical protein [Geodermatophilus sabuli]MBB3086951.1 uncharacterized protein YjbJ (UPF0337 family) [Geodermatophilus sabuli]SNX99269.1 hypothetical protein SAMN06893097_11661 [Geodermatophilus sabuli]